MNTKVFRSLTLFVLATFAGALAFAQQPATQPDLLRQHVTYLASDELAGRRTGTPGANAAASYIAREFERYKLGTIVELTKSKPGEVYQQRFPYVAGVELGQGNLLKTRLANKDGETIVLKSGEDWLPLAFSQTGTMEKPEGVFVGYGISAPDLKHDDYDQGVAKGKLAITLSGTPDGDNPHGQFARYEDVRWKAIAARNAGAIGLLVIAREPEFKDDRLSQLRYDNSAGEAGLFVLAISQAAAVRVFGVGDMSYLAKLAGPPESSAVAVTTLGFFNGFERITIDVKRNEVLAANVIGILTGSDPKLKDEVIVLGAHYDHLGLGGEGSLAPKSGEIHHGADDNASGTAALLELARTFAAQKPGPKRTLVFIAFSGEEEGLLGSNYYVNHPWFPLANTVAMINMDMIGRMKDNKLIIGGLGTAPEWRDLIARKNVDPKVVSRAELASMPKPGKVTAVVDQSGTVTAAIVRPQRFELTLSEDGFGPSDHSSFYAKQVPVLFFWTGTHSDYHKPSDTADKINYVDEARIVEMVAQVVAEVDQSEKRPTYALAKSESTGRSTGFRVSLGTIPNYADSSDGLLLDGVREDSPASKAGLKAGDKIVKLAGRDVRNVYDYTYALGEMKAGQEYDVEVMRGGERLKLKIVPAARK
ncbi:MAG TPA: M20/M25/M40 family metallo-hydrolase [Pyrinomonadaceae bacterium]|nr:M20/M25/M40 family metallo-hydrolase [Pyrinomonadaceae bacterium]